MTIKGTYPESANGLFRVIDTIGVPHPYVITPRHVTVASDHHSGILDDGAIRNAEENHGARCGHPRCNLTFDQHEQALLVEVDEDTRGNEALSEALGEYLKSLVSEAEANGYAGFTLSLSDKAREAE